MKLGLLTAAFPTLDLDEVAHWAAAHGFDALELASWPASGAERRRYAGVCHVDAERLDDEAVARVRRSVEDRDLEISSLAYYPNNLDPDPATRAAAHAHLRRVIDAAARLGVPTVGTFVGRDQRQSEDESLSEFERVWPELIRYAGERGVNVAIENCPMIFSPDEWPGGRNLAYAPALWRELFRIVPDENFGLNFDPSHLVWLMIDYERAIREFADRILHVHAKDLEVDRNGLYERGTMSLGMGWQVPRLPGLGEVRWDRFFAALYAVGYDGVVSVEHEDRRFEGDLDLVQRGFLLARNVLAPYVV